MPQIRDGGYGKTAPLVSFLTSAYRTERYISETIESVLAQIRGDWQLIVVDNGNSDEMARIIGNYTSDPRITLIRQDNKGIDGEFSAAANAADGRYLCPLASDDALDPHYCERIGALIDADPGIDAVGCNAVLFWDPDADNRQKPREYFASIGRKTTPNPSRAVTFTELLDEGVPPYAGAIRRETWDAHGGFEPPADVEPDVTMWLRLVAAGHDVRILPDRLVSIRQRPDSSSRDPANIDAISERLERTLSPGRPGAGPERERHGRDRDAASVALLQRVAQGQIGTPRRRRAGRAYCGPRCVPQRRTLRAAAVLGGLHLSPGLLAAIHPAKNRLASALRRAHYRMLGQLRGEAPSRLERAGARAPLEGEL